VQDLSPSLCEMKLFGEDDFFQYKKLPIMMIESLLCYFFRREINKEIAAMVTAPMIIGVFFNLLSDVYSLSFKIKLIFCGRSASRRMK